MTTGTVMNIVADRGFAFVDGDDGVRYFVHATAFPRDVALATLSVGQRVSFRGTAGERGPRAEQAELIDG